MSVFKCIKHNFDCEIPAEWRVHTAEAEHTKRGVIACAQCNISVKSIFTGKSVDEKPTICKSCTDKLLAKKGESNE